MKKLITIAACLIATALLHAQTTIFVTPSGTGDGTSWATACNLETAIAVAERSRASAPLSDQTEIWVQKGTYYPTKMLVVPDSVKIYGGFSGTENNLSQRNFVANPTIVDGQQKIGSIFRLENSAELHGLTIQNGNANGNLQKSGGGVWADENCVIANCIIMNNTASLNGGGIYAKGKVEIINSTVRNNVADGGSGNDLFGNCIVLGSEQPCINLGVEIAGCNDGSFDFGEISFISPTERTITGTVDGQPLTQIWSDAVTATNCQKTTYAGGSNPYNVDCRTNPSYSGDLFSWCAVARFAYVLCPEPWRVPTKDDFINLDKALGGPGTSRTGASAMLPSYTGTGVNQWGGAYGGFCYSDGSLGSQDSHAYYWSQSEYSSSTSYNLGLLSSGSIYPPTNGSKYVGCTLRCVR